MGAIWSEEDIELKAGSLEHKRKISAKLGKDGVADIAARVANAGCQIFDRAIRSDDRTSERLRNAGQKWDREDMSAARYQNTANLIERGHEIGNMLERLGRQHQVKTRIQVR